MGRRSHSSDKQSGYWLFGKHACAAALENPAREVKRVLVTRNVASLLGEVSVYPEIVDPKAIESVVGTGVVHQGIAVQVKLLEGVFLDDVLEQEKPIILLDKVTDPHNVGAILRSAAAFDAGAVVQTKDGAARESGVMAKAACGGLDRVPLVTVVNLVQAMEKIKKAGYWVAGMDGRASKHLGEAEVTKKTAFVFGAEGAGLRRLTAEHCDLLVKLPIHPQMESLNVSNAAAIALYHLYV